MNVYDCARTHNPMDLPSATHPYYAKVAGLIQRVLPSQPDVHTLEKQQDQCYGVVTGLYIAGLVSRDQWEALAVEIARLANERLAYLTKGVAA